VIGAYGKEFSKTKLLDQKFHRWLIEGFDTRLIGDYHVDTKIEMDTIANMINQAREFYEAALRYLEK
ncbi:MAG: DNA-binding protein, partial [Chloroflexi bacterium]|nr:DNA-binding protein [Chloroflexota bacterium]